MGATVKNTTLGGTLSAKTGLCALAFTQEHIFRHVVMFTILA